MKRLLLLFMLLATGIGLVQAQGGYTVTGVVTDATDGSPLPLANVQIKGTSNGAVTDNDGRFTLRVPSGDVVLVFFYTGYRTQEVPVAGKTTFNIALKEANEEIDQVVVVAYGTVKKESLVGSQGAVSSKEMEKRPLTNVSSALAGSVSGLQMTTGSGNPGAGAPSIRIRGIGSVNASSAPLIIVDGAPYNGALTNINMADVQSLTVLKDAASTALYGSSAGNGVIMITTKSGAGADGSACDAKPSFTFTTTQGISMHGMSRYETLGIQDHVRLLYEGIYNGKRTGKNALSPTLAWLTSNQELYNNFMKQNPFAGIQSFYDGNFTPVMKLTGQPDEFPIIMAPNGKLNPEITGLLWPEDLDWESALYRLGYRQEYTVTGGLSTKRMRSFVSLGYLNEKGYTLNTHFSRFSARLNVSYDINKWITLGTNLTYAYRDQKSPKSLGNYTSNPFNFLNGMAPFYPIHEHNLDGSYVFLPSGEKKFDYERGRRTVSDGYNPILESDLDANRVKTDVFGSRNFLRVNIYDGLTFTMNLAYDMFSQVSKLRFNGKMGDQAGSGLLEKKYNRYQTITFNQLLQYRKEFADAHEIDILLGHENYDYSPNGFSAQKKREAYAKIDEFTNYSEMDDISSWADSYRKEGYFARAAYSYKSRYNASVSYRYDGSSKFASDHHFGHFWSAGLAWNLGNEPFMQGVQDIVNVLKLRASIGQTGVDGEIGYYASKDNWKLGNKNVNLPALDIIFGNKQLRWEKQTSYDFGVDFSLWNRLSGTVEFFAKASSDLIFEFPLPLSVGLDTQDRNIGKVVNLGLEFELTGTVLQMENVRWDVSVNGTLVRNRITELPEQNKKDGIISGRYKLMEGKSRYEFFLEEFIKIDEKNGRPIYRLDPEKDPDGKTALGTSGEEATWTYDQKNALRHFSGSALPKLYGGFGTTLTAYGVDFGMLFSYQIGGRTYDYQYSTLMGARVNSAAPLHKDALKAWKQEGDVTNVPVRNNATDYTRNDLDGTDYYLIDGSALMLKSLTLGYTFPNRLVEPLKIKGLRVGLSAENLFLLSRRKGLNPMQSISGAPVMYSYEFARTVTGSLTFNF